MKKVTSLILVLVLVFSLAICGSAAATANADGYSTIASDARNGVVRILAHSYSYNETWVGSGFAIGEAGEPAYVFGTNHHVVEDADFLYILLDDDWALSIPEAGGADDSVHAVKVEVIYDNTTGPDYAIIRAKRVIDERVALPIMLSHQAVPGDTVYALGYPVISDDVDNKSSGGIEGMTVTKGTISRFTTYTYANDARVIQTDTYINGGNSGGPMITEEGYVIGLNTWGNDDGSLNLALEIDYLVDTLEDLVGTGVLKDFKYTLITDRSAAGSKLNTTMIIAIAAVAGVLIAIIVVVIVVKKRGKKDDTDYHTVPSDMDMAQSNVCLVGISGIYTGQRIPVGKPLFVGRKGCDISFPDGTPGVSGRHCQISPASGGIVVTDVGSSMGTFQGNGSPMVRNQSYTLRHGDEFYLGGRGQGFRVEVAGQASAAQTSAYTLVCTGGVLAGRRVSLSRNISIGRGDANDIVYPRDTAGISGNHCTVNVSGNTITLIDQGSTYGTYLNNGTKLTPGAAVNLHHGDSFYIGSRKNTFRIE